jgi:hypothetical protein
MKSRSFTYYGVYNGINFIQLRHSEMWGWELGVDYNNDGRVKSHHWERLEGKILEQVEPTIKEHGFLLPRSIISEQEYNKALARAEVLMDAKPNTRESKELELLAIKIELWEDDKYPIDKPKEQDSLL